MAMIKHAIPSLLQILCIGELIQSTVAHTIFDGKMNHLVKREKY